MTLITKILHRNGQNYLRPLKNLPSQTNITRDTTMVNIDYVNAQLHIHLIEQGAEYYNDPTLCFRGQNVSNSIKDSSVHNLIKHFMLVNYVSRVVILCIFKSGTTLES